MDFSYTFHRESLFFDGQIPIVWKHNFLLDCQGKFLILLNGTCLINFQLIWTGKGNLATDVNPSSAEKTVSGVLEEMDKLEIKAVYKNDVSYKLTRPCRIDQELLPKYFRPYELAS